MELAKAKSLAHARARKQKERDLLESPVEVALVTHNDIINKLVEEVDQLRARVGMQEKRYRKLLKLLQAAVEPKD